MDNEHDDPHQIRRREVNRPLSHTIDNKARRHHKAIGQRDNPVWFWLGMFGLVGWSVSVPTVLGVLLGWWLDHRYPEGMSWTLNLLVLGLAVGCWNAWHWLSRESRHDGHADSQ